jgi:transcriptional regulator with XRE-family HTH domain
MVQYVKYFLRCLITKMILETLRGITMTLGTLGMRVEFLRKDRKMSQEELAARAHISQGLLSRIERGQTKNPGADVLKGLARALGCSIDFIVGLYEEPACPPTTLAGVS